MKKYLSFFLLTILHIGAFAQQPSANGIDEKINEFIAPATNLISDIVFYSVKIAGINIPIIVFWLVLAAVLFTFYFGFINITAFKHSLQVVRGDYDNPMDKGEVSHFQALATALSGTVGLGNIAGVAVAISTGGPGATFWMILAGFLGMTSKFLECTLGVKYRKENMDGTVSGGPMYYLEKGFANRGYGILGKVLAVFFAVMCIGGSFGGGNMFQGNQAAAQLLAITGGTESFMGNKTIIGLIMAILVGMVIIGGIKSIAKVTEKIVPFMCGIYVLAALVVLVKYIHLIPGTFVLIFEEAFSPSAITGGLIGVLIIGFQRAAFSNEAGVGSASIAHSAVKTNEPVSEGIVALLEPFVDTILVCTMTALVTIITKEYMNPATDGIAQTSAAFAHVLSWFPYILSIAVVLFAISTMLSWSYYGLKAWTYIFGESRESDLTYKIIFCIVIIIGSAMELDNVIGFSDAMIFAMAFVNIIGMYLFAPEIKKDLRSYFDRVKSGEIKKFK